MQETKLAPTSVKFYVEREDAPDVWRVPFFAQVHYATPESAIRARKILSEKDTTERRWRIRKEISESFVLDFNDGD